MNKSIDNIEKSNAQLELGFSANSLQLASGAPRTGRQLAAWWFQRMRDAVDRAVEWSPRSEPRPEQIWLPHTHRSIDTRLAVR